MALVSSVIGGSVKRKAARQIDPTYLDRAFKIPRDQVGDNLDSIAISLHQALDSWRYRNGPAEDVALCVDALIALWTTVEERTHGH
jgi:hypothetical protein